MAALVMLSACAKEENPVNPDPDPDPKKEILDTVITHNFADGDELLAGMERLPAEVYSPSKLHTVYYPILVKRAVGSTADPNNVVWRPEKTRVLYNIAGFTPDTTAATYNSMIDKYGGNMNLPQQTATGRFYTKKIGERWWIVDPLGYLRYERSVTSFRKGGSARNATAWNQRFGSDDNWCSITAEELAAIGFHGTGAFCSGTYRTIQNYNAAHPDRPLTLCPSVGFIGTFKIEKGYPYPADGDNDDADNLIGLVFYPGWEEWCKDYARRIYADYKDDPNVMGVFSDNEIDFGSTNGTNPRLLDRFLKIKDDNDPAKKAALDFINSRGIDPKGEMDDFINSDFAGIVAEKYYSAVSAAIKEFDPGLMYLGSRLHGQPKYLPGVIEAAGKYCDIISINYYSRWSPELTTKISQWEKYTDTPFMVTEFYTKGLLDNDLSNQSGAGFGVPTQKERAYAYQHFTLGLLEAQHCVGWQWFKYQDDDFPDNSNMPCNKGVYDNAYNMYPYLGEYMKVLNFNAYSLIEWFDSKR